MPVRGEDERAAFAEALQRIANEEPLEVQHHDALSVLEGANLEEFDHVWEQLSAGARARLIRALRDAAERRLRLDFSTLNWRALRDADEQVRLAAVEAAVEDRSEHLLNRLLEMLRDDPSAAVRQAVAEDLARFTLLAELEDLQPADAARLRDALLAALRDEREAPGVRSSALAALGYFSDAQVAGELSTRITDPALHLGAIRGMGRSADPRWTTWLVPVLASDDAGARLEAVRSLQEIEDERAVAPLADLVDDSAPEVRVAAIQALGAIGGEEAREALLYALQAPDRAARQAAEQALGQLEENEGGIEL